MKSMLFKGISFLSVIFFSSNYQAFSQKPNIIIILSDDQGWGDLGFNGNSSVATPNIDRLAKGGIILNRFFVSPVCSPTRAELLTGRHHVRCGVSSTSTGKERLDLDETTIADIFKKAGYQTAAYGKWHNGGQAPYHPNSRGFNDFYGFCSGHWGNYFDPVLEHNGEIVTGNGFIIDDLTDHGLAFIEKNKKSPFFLYLPYNTPHSPMQVPEQWWKKYANKNINQHGTDAKKEEIDHTRAALALSENIDWNVGRIMKKLEDMKLLNNTIVLYFSDNGPNGNRWNGGMKGIKGSTDEGGIRSPMIINWKGKLPINQKIETICSAIDLLPTLCDLANINYVSPKPLDGKSLKPLFQNSNTKWSDRILYHYWQNKLSLRNQNYRLSDTDHLFDMEKDPNQLKDIAESNVEEYTKLKKAKTQWIKEVLSELPQKDSRPFIIGHPSLETTQLPAGEATGTGNIKPSNKYPNDSYLTNWINVEDQIYWDVEVAEAGDFEIEIYYTCPKQDIGSTFSLTFLDTVIEGKIIETNDPPLKGIEHDKSPRIESYIKDFKPLILGEIYLEKGPGRLFLKAKEISGTQVMDFKMLTLKRL
ncbi:MAG: arylsulfatase [Cytophagaceae bacterium]|nr:arylsulfatase [Cytophagaceae bacterium]